MITRRHTGVLWACRALGALLLVFVGVDHYYEYSARSYSVIPTIGVLFLLNFIAATTVGLLLISPVARLLRRYGALALTLIAASGAAIAGTSLLALLVSEQTQLFGFMEYNYRPEIVIAIASEAAAMLVLSALTVLLVRWSGPARLKQGRATADPDACMSAS
jgi:hypothetical protein